MTGVLLHAVPRDDVTPFPLSPQRVEKALARLGLAAYCHPKSDTLEATARGQRFLFSLGDSRAVFSVRTVWETGAPYHPSAELLFAAADTWNRERFFPTVYISQSPDEAAQVSADFLTPCRAGLSNAQLDDAIDLGIAAGTDAIRFMKGASASVLRLPARARRP